MSDLFKKLSLLCVFSMNTLQTLGCYITNCPLMIGWDKDGNIVRFWKKDFEKSVNTRKKREIGEKCYGSPCVTDMCVGVLIALCALGFIAYSIKWYNSKEKSNQDASNVLAVEDPLLSVENQNVHVNER